MKDNSFPIKNSSQDLAKNLDKNSARFMYKNLIRFMPKNGTRILQEILLRFMQKPYKFFCKIIKDSCQNLTKSDKIHARTLQVLTMQEPYKI